MIVSNIEKSNVNQTCRGSSWIIDSVVDHTINISKYDPLADSRYVRIIPKIIGPLKKELIIIQNVAIIKALNGA